jgi:hypothetical protein
MLPCKGLKQPQYITHGSNLNSFCWISTTHVRTVCLFLSAAAAGATLSGGAVPMPGATVTYTFSILNGQKALTANTTTLAITVSPEVTPINVVCRDAANTTVAATGLNFPPTDLAAAATITCTIGVAVTQTHATAGTIPAFTVSAGLTPPDIALTMEPITMPAVPVQIGSTLAVSAAVPRAGTFLQGECSIQRLGRVMCIERVGST